MGKIGHQELVKAVTSELVTYLGSGTLNTRRLTQSLDYSGLNISEFDRLKELHFVLHKDVVDYVDRLPERLRRLKTVNQREQVTTHGEIRGRIDWRTTHQQRYQRGFHDPTLFVVHSPEIEYDIPENRVVKKLLSAIAQPLSRDVSAIDEDWRGQWAEQDIVELQQTLAQNVYLSRLPDPHEIQVGKRDLHRAAQARQELYTEGQRLLQLYDDLMNNRFERPDVRAFLQETLIVPTQTHRLFELFCLFGVVRRIQRRYPQLELHRIHPGSSAAAVLENSDTRIEVYYTQGGPLSFFERYPQTQELVEADVPELFVKQGEVLDSHARILKGFTGKGTDRNFFGGIPDFTILRYSESVLDEVVIGEVKYTESIQTFSQGLEELLEYIHFARENDAYLFEQGTTEKVAINGLICSDTVTTDTNTVENITHLRADDIQSYFGISAP